MINFHKRTFVKGCTWELSGAILLALICYIYTGEAVSASLFSIGYTVLRVGMYYLHERIWKRTSWGKSSLPKEEDSE